MAHVRGSGFGSDGAAPHDGVSGRDTASRTPQQRQWQVRRAQRPPTSRRGAAKLERHSACAGTSRRIVGSLNARNVSRSRRRCEIASRASLSEGWRRESCWRSCGITMSSCSRMRWVESATLAAAKALAIAAARFGSFALAAIVTTSLVATGVASTLSRSPRGVRSRCRRLTTLPATACVRINLAVVWISRLGSPDAVGSPRPRRVALSEDTGVINRSAVD